MLRLFCVIMLTLSASLSVDARNLRTAITSLDASSYTNLQSETLAVSNISIKSIDSYVLLAWEPALRTIKPTIAPLSGYVINFGTNIDDLKPIDYVKTPEYTFRSESLTQGGFFSVMAVYGKFPDNIRTPRGVTRDGMSLLNFEEGDYQFESYSDAEDRQPDRWEVTNRQAYGQTQRALRLYGNTWKSLAFNRTFISDSTVWQIAFLTIDGDTSSDMQAFGVGDGAQELFYSFSGRQTFWRHSWMVANQEARPRGRWNVYKLNIGYDWKVRYGYNPNITQLFFVNDNDTNNPAAEAYFDELNDITTNILPEPKPKFRWRVDPTVDVDGTVVLFSALVENRELDDVDLIWDFGDGTTGRGFDIRHVYRYDGLYSVGLTVRGNDGLTGRASTSIEIGEIRMPTIAKLAFTGDVMLARRYEDMNGIITRYGPEYVFSRIRERTTAADMFVINLECPLTDEGVPHPTKDYVFRGRPQNIAGLVYTGVDVATLSNNHVSDYGDRGLEETMEVLDAAKIAYCGAGMNEYQALQPVFKTVKGIRIGFLGFCNRTGRDSNLQPYLDAGYDKAGYAYFSADNIINSVPTADDLCDILVIAIHGGSEYAVVPSAVDADNIYPWWSDENYIYSPPVDSATRELAHLAIDLGADLVIGHHPHVLQGFEMYGDVIIAHSLGNFAFDQNIWETWPSAMVWVDVDRGGIKSIDIEPVYVDNYLPTPAVGRLGGKILDRLAGYSVPLNAIVVPDYYRMRARIVTDRRELTERFSERVATGQMRYIATELVNRSEPLRLNAGGFVSAVLSVEPEAQDAGWQVRFGREILWVGGMEKEGAEVWNYNSAYEGRDSSDIHSGRYSSWLSRNAGMQDAVTDLIQRIPVNGPGDQLTLSGWIKYTNARNASLQARWFRYRNDSQIQNIFGDSLVEGRFSGEADWFYVWQDMRVPNNTAFMSPRWQLYAPLAGSGMFWCDDVELVRWEDWIDIPDGQLDIDYPSDLYYLQVQTRRPIENVRVRYRTVTLATGDFRN